MKKFILTASFKIIAGFEEELKQATIALATETHKETGVELFLIHTRDDSPQTIFFYEIYQSEEAFQLHKTYDYTEKYFELLKGRIENDKPEVVLLTALDS
jgi:quinol monooxygenase YgiN